MYSVKYLPPIGNRTSLFPESILHTVENSKSLFIFPSGYLITEGLAAFLKKSGYELLWLRFDPLDCDPACCLLDITNAACQSNGGIETQTIQLMKRVPGPVYGWSHLFDNLALDLEQNLPKNTALVFEGMHQFTANQPALIRHICRFLDKLPADMKQFLISHQTIPQGLMSGWHSVSPDDSQKVDTLTCREILEEEGIRISDECLERVAKLIGGYRVSFSGILEACKLMGSDYVKGSVERATSHDMLLQDLAAGWLGGANLEELYATCLLLETGYYHSEMGHAISGHSISSTGPWMQPLKDDWQRLHSVWQSPLESILRIDQGVRSKLMLLAADYLVKMNAPEVALCIYLKLDEFTRAAELLATLLDDLLATGQWLNLKKWLNKIPENVLADWPWLIYARGEIRAMEGDEKHAHIDFSRATELFTQHGDMHGLPYSLMGESTLAARRNDMAGAFIRAKKFWSLVEQFGFPEQKVWANFQLGVLSANKHQLSEATDFLNEASTSINNSAMAGLVEKTQAQVQEYKEILDRRNHLNQEMKKLDADLQASASEMSALLNSRADNLPELLEQYGWLYIPLMLKLPAQDDEVQEIDDSSDLPLIKRLLGRLNLRPAKTKDDESIKPVHLEIPLPINHPKTSDQTTKTGTIPKTSSQTTKLRKDKPRKFGVPKLTVYCLGPFRVFQDEQPVKDWLSGKGKSIFKYLVTHREYPISKEVLMDLFWPDNDPDSARNNLNVAIYSLRQTLRSSHPSYSHVIFQNESYVLNPEIDIWMDSEVFLEKIALAKSLEKNEGLDAAIEMYTTAEALYLGEFIEEDRYEDWLLPQRQRLQEEYINLLHKLSNYQFDQDSYTACITACRKILAIDPCVEEAHRLMMQCFDLQGQPYLALRQYHQCVETLKNELQVPPSAVIKDLYNKIRSEQDR